MWQDLVLVWEDSEHPWNEFGNIVSAPVNEDDPLFGKPLVVWKGQTVGNFISNILAAFMAADAFEQGHDTALGISLVIAAANLFPVEIKWISEDKHAAQFLALMKEHQGEQYFLKKDLETFPEIAPLIQNFVDTGLLSDRSDRYVILGKVLSRAHIQGQ